MPIPYLGNALKGWTETTQISLVTQTVVDFETVESVSDVSYPANFQPAPAQAIKRIPEEKRGRKHWSVIVLDSNVYFNLDDIVQDSDGLKYRIEDAFDWRKSGFTKYTVTRDYEVST